MSVKINNLKIENVKCIKAVKIEPTINGFTILSGDNNQGKTTEITEADSTIGKRMVRYAALHEL